MTPAARDGKMAGAGGLVVAVGLGIAGGVWCAVRDRKRSARALEGAAVFFLCAPAWRPHVAVAVRRAAPVIVMNVVLVEWVFSTPGFFRHMRRALGENYGAPENYIDIPMLHGLAMSADPRGWPAEGVGRPGDSCRVAAPDAAPRPVRAPRAARRRCARVRRRRRPARAR